MISRIYWGHTEHARNVPKRHSFRYPVLFFALDIGELESTGSPVRLLRLNRFGLFSIWDRDYLRPGAEPIAQKFREFLGRAGTSSMPARTLLITIPRVFGYVFNPVSFYISFDATGRIHSILAEVSNTFGERHAYLLESEALIHEDPGAELPVTAVFPKEFYVSPFLDSQGEYRLRLADCAEKFQLHVSLLVQEKVVFSAGLMGAARELNDTQLLRSAVRFPLSALLTMTRIHLQALLLYFRHGAQLYPKPALPAECSLRCQPGVIHHVRLFLLSKFPRLRKLVTSILSPETLRH